MTAADVTLLLPAQRDEVLAWARDRGLPCVVGRGAARGTLVQTVLDADWLPDGRDLDATLQAAANELGGTVIASIAEDTGGFGLLVRTAAEALVLDLTGGPLPDGAPASEPEVSRVCAVLGHPEVELDVQAALLALRDDDVGYAGTTHARLQLAEALDLPPEVTGTDPAGTRQVVVVREADDAYLPALAAGAGSPLWVLRRGPHLLVQTDQEVLPPWVVAAGLGGARMPQLILTASATEVGVGRVHGKRLAQLVWDGPATPVGLTPEVLRDFGVRDLTDRLGVDRSAIASRVFAGVVLPPAEREALERLVVDRTRPRDAVVRDLVHLLRLPPEVVPLLSAQAHLSDHPDAERREPTSTRAAVLTAMASAGPAAMQSTGWAVARAVAAVAAIALALVVDWPVVLRVLVVLLCGVDLVAAVARLVLARRHRGRERTPAVTA